jgi:hypothetical protein
MYSSDVRTPRGENSLDTEIQLKTPGLDRRTASKSPKKGQCLACHKAATSCHNTES